MRNVAWISLPALLLLASADLSAQPEAGTADTQNLGTDDKLYEWCMSLFPGADNPWSTDDAQPRPRPPAKLRFFDLADALTPSNLITRTEIVGPLPPEIETYKGRWIWPAHDDAPALAIFVERLTPTEMAVAWAFKRKKDLDAADYRDLRTLLKWTGRSFSYSTPNDPETLDAIISVTGEAMLMLSRYSRLVTLEDQSGNQSGHAFGETSPICLISEKYLLGE